jgi:hypothetical protein
LKGIFPDLSTSGKNSSTMTLQGFHAWAEIYHSGRKLARLLAGLDNNEIVSLKYGIQEGKFVVRLPSGEIFSKGTGMAW